MTLLQMRYYCTACKFNNISRAADYLHISQPTVSNAIRCLEEEFNVQLIVRKYHGFDITCSGKKFYEMCNKFLNQSDQIFKVMTDLGSQQRVLNLGIPPMISTVFFPKIYKKCTARYPDIILKTEEKGTLDLLDDLKQGLLDIALVPYSDNTQTVFNSVFEYIPLTKIETVFCVSKRNPLAVKRSISISQISQEPLIMFDPSFHLTEIVIYRFGKKNLVPNIVHYTNQFYTLIKFIEQDIFSGFMFREAANLSNQIVSISLDQPITRNIGCVVKKNRYMDKSVVNFIRLLEYFFKDKKNK